jgi:hypothetical protein
LARNIELLRGNLLQVLGRRESRIVRVDNLNTLYCSELTRTNVGSGFSG